jgi:hypothetical protein
MSLLFLRSRMGWEEKRGSLFTIHKCLIFYVLKGHCAFYSLNFHIIFIYSNTNSALLESLKPFTEYEISVRANGEKLVSEYSDTLKVYTESGRKYIYVSNTVT